MKRRTQPTQTSKRRAARPQPARPADQSPQTFAAQGPELPSLGEQQAWMGLAAFESRHFPG